MAGLCPRDVFLLTRLNRTHSITPKMLQFLHYNGHNLWFIKGCFLVNWFVSFTRQKTPQGKDEVCFFLSLSSLMHRMWSVKKYQRSLSIPLPPGPCTVRWEEENHGSRRGREITFASWDGTRSFSGLYSTYLSHQPYEANFADEETEDQKG